MQRLNSVNHGPFRTELASILEKAAAESDPIKAFALAQEARDKFRTLTQRLSSAREEQARQRNRLSSVTQENESQASRIYRRIAETVKLDLQEGVLQNFYNNSRNLTRIVQNAMSQLSTKDRQFLESINQHGIIFQRIVEELVSNQQH